MLALVRSESEVDHSTMPTVWILGLSEVSTLNSQGLVAAVPPDPVWPSEPAVAEAPAFPPDWLPSVPAVPSPPPLAAVEPPMPAFAPPPFPTALPATRA
jgi:hypothetical protein